MGRVGYVCALACGLIGIARVVAAADHPLPGTRIGFSDHGGRRRITLLLRTPGLPGPTGADAPTVAGASLEITNPTSGEFDTLTMPASSWTANGSGTAYRFRNRTAPAGPSPVRLALVRGGRMIRVTAAGTAFTLNEASQGSLRVTFVAGGERYCALFGGVARDVPGRFIARRSTAPASCGGGGSTTTTPSSTTTSTTQFDFTDLGNLVLPTGDADGDGYSNTLELASCSNPADASSTPLNDSSLCLNQTIFSDTLGPAWGNTNRQTDPTYDLAVDALIAQNALDCGVYCATTSNIGSPEACPGAWPWSGVPEHGFYEAGETVEVNFPDEDGNRLEGEIFLPPGVTCTPSGSPVCDGVTDPVTCTAPGGATYPSVIITEGFIGAQRMYFWAAHRLAEQGYVTMTYDVSGQGRSQGTFPNGDASVGPGGGGFSRDTGAAVNYFVSAANPVRGLVQVSPLAIENQAAGETHVEDYVVGIAGHSAGATGVLSYQMSTETTLYPVRARAVVAWSHFDASPTIGNVPIQLYSGDEDSGFIQPPGSGQAAGMQTRYDRLGGDSDLDGTPDFTKHDRQIIMTEAGTHLDYSQVPWAYYPTWAEEVQYHYTLAWFDKYLKNDASRTMSDVTANVVQSVPPGDYADCAMGPGCYTATQRLEMSHVHLSTTRCSRYDIGGVATNDMKGTSGACDAVN